MKSQVKVDFVRDVNWFLGQNQEHPSEVSPVDLETDWNVIKMGRQKTGWVARARAEFVVLPCNCT